MSFLLSIAVVLTRFRPYIPQNGMSEVISNKFIEYLKVWDMSYTISFTFFLSFQMVVLANLGSCTSSTGFSCNTGQSCGGLSASSALICYISSLITRFYCSTGNRFLVIFNISMSFVMCIVTIVYYDFSSTMGLMPLLYVLLAILCYCYERRYRELFLMRIIGREVLKDIVEYKQNHQLSAQLSKELMDIIECTAHDMKSPCTAMQLGLDSLRDLIRQPISNISNKNSDNESDNSLFQSVHEEACQLVHNLKSTLAFMIMTNNRSMDFAKLHRGLKLVPVLEMVAIKHIIEWSINCVNWQADETVVLAPESSGIDLVGVTEKSWLRDNILCILANGSKHTADGERVVIRVNKLSLRGREWVEVKVTDGGPAIDRINFFEPPTQLKRKEVGGRGLGLYCLAKRVSILQGAYGADERKDGKEGSVIWFRIPFHDNKRLTTGPKSSASSNSQQQEADKAAAALRSSVGGTDIRQSSVAVDNLSNGRSSNSGKRSATPKQSEMILPDLTNDPDYVEIPLKTALIVDDSIPILKMSALVLERAGCTVDKAKNGSIGLEKMRKQLYDLVIMDVQMPVMTGVECVKRLRKFESECVPPRARQLMVGVSANSEGVMKSICVEAGMDFFTIKPFALEDILAIYKQGQMNRYIESKNNQKMMRMYNPSGSPGSTSDNGQDAGGSGGGAVIPSRGKNSRKDMQQKRNLLASLSENAEVSSAAANPPQNTATNDMSALVVTTSGKSNNGTCSTTSSSNVQLHLNTPILSGIAEVSPRSEMASQFSTHTLPATHSLQLPQQQRQHSLSHDDDTTTAGAVAAGYDSLASETDKDNVVSTAASEGARVPSPRMKPPRTPPPMSPLSKATLTHTSSANSPDVTVEETLVKSVKSGKQHTTVLAFHSVVVDHLSLEEIITPRTREEKISAISPLAISAGEMDFASAIHAMSAAATDENQTQSESVTKVNE